MFASRLRTSVFSILFSFVNWILSRSWSRNRVMFSRLLSEPECSSQFDLHWASPHLLRGMQRICGPFVFLEFIHYACHEIFVSQRVLLCSSIYIETALNTRAECNESADLLFWRLSFYAFRDSLSCDTNSLSSLYLCYIPPHSCTFRTFCFTPIFAAERPKGASSNIIRI